MREAGADKDTLLSAAVHEMMAEPRKRPAGPEVHERFMERLATYLMGEALDVSGYANVCLHLLRYPQVRDAFEAYVRRTCESVASVASFLCLLTRAACLPGPAVPRLGLDSVTVEEQLPIALPHTTRAEDFVRELTGKTLQEWEATLPRDTAAASCDDHENAARLEELFGVEQPRCLDVHKCAAHIDESVMTFAHMVDYPITYLEKNQFFEHRVCDVDRCFKEHIRPYLRLALMSSQAFRVQPKRGNMFLDRFDAPPSCTLLPTMFADGSVSSIAILHEPLAFECREEVCAIIRMDVDLDGGSDADPAPPTREPTCYRTNGGVLCIYAGRK